MNIASRRATIPEAKATVESSDAGHFNLNNKTVIIVPVFNQYATQSEQEISNDWSQRNVKDNTQVSKYPDNS